METSTLEVFTSGEKLSKDKFFYFFSFIFLILKRGKRDDTNFLHHTLAYYDPKEPIMKKHPVTITNYKPVERKY